MLDGLPLTATLLHEGKKQLVLVIYQLECLREELVSGLPLPLSIRDV